MNNTDALAVLLAALLGATSPPQTAALVEQPERAGAVLARWLLEIGRPDDAVHVAWRAGLIGDDDIELAWLAGRDVLEEVVR